MPIYTVRSRSRVQAFNSSRAFASEVRRLLRLGSPFVADVLNGARPALELLRDALHDAGIALVVDPASDPDAVDYIANSFGGAMVGAISGGLAGAGTWALLRAVGVAIPPAAPFIGGAALVGVAVGMAGGMAATKWGLRVRFQDRSGGSLEMSLAPLGARETVPGRIS